MIKKYYNALPASYKEFAKYFIFTGLATIADFVTLLFLRQNFNIKLWIANVFAFCVGLILNYIFIKIFVFKKSKFENKAYEMILFLAISIAGLYVNTFVLTLLAEKHMISEPISKFFATGVSFVFNFVLKKLVIFKR